MFLSDLLAIMADAASVAAFVMIYFIGRNVRHHHKDNRRHRDNGTP
jgi:hypothetical protein